MPSFIWPDLYDRTYDPDDYPGQSALVRQWCDAFEGWEFSLPQCSGRIKVVPSQSFYSEYSGGVQLYTYVWHVDRDDEGRWLSYAKGTPSELRRSARNFKRSE